MLGLIKIRTWLPWMACRWNDVQRPPHPIKVWYTDHRDTWWIHLWAFKLDKTESWWRSSEFRICRAPLVRRTGHDTTVNDTAIAIEKLSHVIRTGIRGKSCAMQAMIRIVYAKIWQEENFILPRYKRLAMVVESERVQLWRRFNSPLYSVVCQELAPLTRPRIPPIISLESFSYRCT